MAKDFSLASEKDKAQVQDHVKGLLAEDVVRRQCEAIELDTDSYIGVASPRRRRRGG